MSEKGLERLDPDLAALLRRAEPYPDGPRDAQRRVHSALLQRIAMADALGTPQDGTHASGVAPAPRATPGLLSLGTKPILTLVTTFALGASMGAGLHAALRPPRERVIFVERSAVATTPSSSRPNDVAAPAQTAPEVPASAAIVPPSAHDGDGDGVAGAHRGTPPSRDGSRSSSNLGAEQALLDVARAALARGRADEALSPLDRHARQYPRGMLAEEREALAVNVLVTLGLYDQARERSARFLARYPGSLLRASVEAAVEAIP
jgi:hypothetical protein